MSLGQLRLVDGVEISLRANVELPTEFQAVRDFGACGVGLFRSEFLLSRPGLMSSEDGAVRSLQVARRSCGRVWRDRAAVRCWW